MHGPRCLPIFLAIAVCATMPHPSCLTAQQQNSKFPEKSLKKARSKPVVTALAIDKSAEYVAAAGDDHIIRIRRIKTLQEVSRLAGHIDWIKTLCFSPTAGLLVSAGNDGRIMIWDVATATLQRTIQHGHAISRIAFHPGGNYLAVVGFGVELHLYDLSRAESQPTTLKCPCSDMRAVCFSGDGNYLAAGGRNGAIRVWRFPERRLFDDRKPHRKRIRDMAFVAGRLISVSEDQAVYVWPLLDKQQKPFLLKAPTKMMSLASYGPQRIVTGGSDNRLRFWDLEKRHQIGYTQDHTGTIAAVACRNTTVASGSFDTTVRLFNAIDVENALRRQGNGAAKNN